MASTDFTEMTGSLSLSSIDRTVTSGVTPPAGGGSFVYGFRSLDDSVGAAALFANAVNFAPMSKGGSVRAAIRRENNDGCSPFLFIGAQSANVSSVAYMLGLSAGPGSRIELRKGTIGSGLPNGQITVPPTDGVLRLSDEVIAAQLWVHLRLDMVQNANGDVVLNCYQNPSVNLVTSPEWELIPGIASFVDDALSVNSGSAPLSGGRIGWGFHKTAGSRLAFVDYVDIRRQT